MNKCLNIIIGVVLLTLCPASSFAQVSNDNEDGVNKVDTRFASQDFVPGQVLVKFKDVNRIQVRRAQGKFASTNVDNVTAVLQKYGVGEMEQLLPNEKPNRQLRRAKAYNGDVIQEHDLSQLYCVTLSAEHHKETMQAVEELKALDEVEFAEPNYRVYAMGTTNVTNLTTSDTEVLASDYSGNPMESQQWYLDAYGVKELWDKPIINKERPIIAILDTGVDLTHPDLKDNLWTNTIEEYGTKDNDNDGNGFKNDVHGWDFVNNSPNIRDNNMHGTHVAGIAAAANNGIGIIGANPQALIMPITVLQSDGAGDVRTIIKGINYAVDNGATVLNMSLGVYNNSIALRQSLENAYNKAVLVAAAGNEGVSICFNHRRYERDGAFACFPAAYSFVLGVQATNVFNEITEWSNYDNDGKLYSCVSTMDDPDGFNYELLAPGRNILSTVPGGNYRQMSGTSMAAPLVAGSISALMMLKQYDTQEILWGEILHTANIAQAYSLTSRPAELDMQKVILHERKELTDLDEEDYSGDNEVDAGETVSIYPIIRTTFGPANNIKLKLMVDEFEDPDIVEFVKDEVDFGMRLDSYGKAVSLNPLVLKVPSTIADGRHISLKVIATCDEMTKEAVFPFTVVVQNMVKISGLINEDMILSSNHIYYVNGHLGINKGCTLTIEPGTRLEFGEGVMLMSFGKLVANGTKETPIVFTNHGDGLWDGIYSDRWSDYAHMRDSISYCRIDNCSYVTWNATPAMAHCVLSFMKGGVDQIGDYNVIHNCYDIAINGMFTNIVNNKVSVGFGTSITEGFKGNQGIKSNFINNYDSNKYMISCESNTLKVVKMDEDYMYFGTSREDLIRPYVYELGNGKGTWASVDLTNMSKEPFKEAHGIIWKILVNGKDAQDEFEDLPPLGVGKHKFEIFFNRPMNINAIPKVSFGVREPYTQQNVAEDGYWNEEGTIYTVYKTITGKTNSDGLNRIYVQGAEDNEFFPCPYEKTRFNVVVQAAGSLSAGFMVEAGLGCVNLSWNDAENDFEDAMGINVYRYSERILPEGWRDGEWHDKEIVYDTIRLNQNILDLGITAYTDYDVEPGVTYYYYYEFLSSDLKAYGTSHVVAATPLTSTRGDANGSGTVDVADVVTTVNYITKQNPQPFIFEAADMNTDNVIDILDVMGIVKGILNPTLLAASLMNATAIYTIEDGMLYVESDVALGGVQVQLTLDGRGKTEDVRVAEDLDGFEQASAWLSDNDYLFLAYSMNGKTLTPGKHTLLYIGDAEISSLRLSDTQGKNVNTISGDGTTGIDRMGKQVMSVNGIYDLYGRKIVNSELSYKQLPHGVYIINGRKVVK